VKQAVPLCPIACFDIWLAAFHIMEMLYDALFPDTPQTDRIEKADRNAELITRYEAGETGVSIARIFGISEQRVSQIIRRRETKPGIFPIQAQRTSEMSASMI
jgi:hypothetical protein